MSSRMERVILVNSDEEGDGDDEEEDDLYKGYNEFHPVLDTRNLQEDEMFKETVNKSSYGSRPSVSKHRTNTSTAGVAFNRSSVLKSRQTAASRGTRTGRSGASGGGPPPSTAAGARPLTAIRGAGYTSAAGAPGGLFDPLGLANSANGVPGTGTGKSSQFHLQNENTPEIKIKQLELQINRMLEESINAGSLRKDWPLALDLAKDCVAKERSLNRMKEQSGLMDSFGPNTDLTFATMFNLAEQYSNMKMWPESINAYQSILKNRSFTNTGRLKMNIGEIYYRQANYPKAIKFFRMALDQVANTQNELRLKLMQNIGLSFVRLAQFADSIASFEYIMSEKGDQLDPLTIFHLIVCYYALGDPDKMRYYFNKLLQVKVDDQFEERYGHHEILTNGGNLFATPSSPMHGASSGDLYNSRPSYMSPSAEFGTGGSAGGSGAGGNRASSPILLIRDKHDHHNKLLIEALRNDRLRRLEKKKIAHAEWCILTAAKLIAPFIAIQANGLLMPSSHPASTIRHNGHANNDNNNGDSNGRKASLIEPTFNIPDTADINAGFEWCLEQIRRQASVASISSTSISGLNFVQLADELELHKAVKHLRAREFDKAIQTLKLFEKKDRLSMSSMNNPVSARATTAGGTLSVTPTFNEQPRLATAASGGGGGGATSGSVSSATTARVAATAATNLSFFYILQRDFETASRYTDEAIQINRYSFGALLNKGTVLYHGGDYHQAAECYREVVATNQTSLEAHFNLALAERKLENYEKALEILARLRSLTKMVPNSQGTGGVGGQSTTTTTSGLNHHHGNNNSKNLYNQKISNTIDTNVLYQIGSIYETMGNIDQATDIYQQILNIVPTDISLLVKMADLAAESNDRKQSLSYLMEAYRYLPSHIPTIERLAAYHIEMKMYEKAIKHLEQLTTIQPSQIKWQLMIAASYRRAGNYQQAFSSYQEIHSRFPDNLDCLKLLIRLCTELEAEDTRSSRVRSGGTNYANLADQYTETLKRLEKSRELREQQQLLQLQQNSSSSRSASRTSGGFRSREGSAATSTSSGGSSSGYNTSATPRSVKTPSKSATPNNLEIGQNGRTGSSQSEHHQKSSISAIVDQVVEQLDHSTLNERPTTSWRRKSAFGKNRSITTTQSDHHGSSSMSMINGNNDNNGGQPDDDDDDLLLDANIDEILPD